MPMAFYVTLASSKGRVQHHSSVDKLGHTQSRTSIMADRGNVFLPYNFI